MRAETESSAPRHALLYWRRWWPLTCDPVLLRLADGLLELTTADGEVEFRVAVREVEVRLTAWTTLVLTVDGSRYDLVGTPLPYARRPTDAQLRVVAPGAVERRRASALGAAAVSAGSSGVAGVAAMATAYAPGRRAVRAWRDALIDAGAKTT